MGASLQLYHAHIKRGIQPQKLNTFIHIDEDDNSGLADDLIDRKGGEVYG